MGARPQNRARRYPRPSRRPPVGGAGETRAAGQVPADGEVTEHRTGDGTVVARYSVADHVPVIVPRTGLAGRVAHDPAVAAFLQQQVASLRVRAGQAGGGQPDIGLSATRSAGTRRARAAAWTYSPPDAGWGDIALEVVPTVWSRLADRFRGDAAGPWFLFAAVSGAVAGIANAEGGNPVGGAVWFAGAAGCVVWAFRSQRCGFDADRAMVAALCAGVATRDPFTFRDVDVAPFTPVCVCPSCDTLALHWFATADTVPAHTADELPGPVVWRDCAGIGCGFVWPQLR